MAGDGQIDLARTAPFRIGQLLLDPPIRHIRRDDGAEEVVEPRVMQVLIALAEARSTIVTRHTLNERCWEGRIVGEDAINRVMSRLRRIAEGIGAGSFALETITRIGYRLSVEGDAPHLAMPAETSPVPERGIGRRGLIAAGGTAAILAAGGFALWRHQVARARVPSDIADLMAQAEVALRQGVADQTMTGIGLLRRVVTLQPDYADGWAKLATGYAMASHGVSPDQTAAYRARAKAAADRGRALDPANPDLRLFPALLLPRMGHWLESERICRAVLSDHPDHDRALFQLSLIYGAVGRCREQAALLDHLGTIGAPTPTFLYQHCQALWSAGRLEDADRATDEAMVIAPRQFQVWFTRFYFLLYTSRIDQAIGMAQDVDNRATTIAPAEYDRIIAVARAMRSRDAAEIDAVEKMIVDAAHHGSGYAENSIQFAAALGRLDTAFRIARGYFLGQGFAVDDVRFQPEGGAFSPLRERRPHILFLPSTQGMRTDPRFNALTSEIGLEKYWRESRSRPDYRA